MEYIDVKNRFEQLFATDTQKDLLIVFALGATIGAAFATILMCRLQK